MLWVDLVVQIIGMTSGFLILMNGRRFLKVSPLVWAVFILSAAIHGVVVDESNYLFGFLIWLPVLFLLYFLGIVKFFMVPKEDKFVEKFEYMKLLKSFLFIPLALFINGSLGSWAASNILESSSSWRSFFSSLFDGAWYFWILVIPILCVYGAYSAAMAREHLLKISIIAFIVLGSLIVVANLFGTFLFLDKIDVSFGESVIWIVYYSLSIVGSIIGLKNREDEESVNNASNAAVLDKTEG